MLAVEVTEVVAEAFEDIIVDVIEAVSTIKVPDGISLNEEAVILSGSVLAAEDMLMVLLAGSAVALEAVEVAQSNIVFLVLLTFAKAATAARSATSHALSTASIRDGTSCGLEQMHWASVAWQPDAWIAANRAGSAHDGRPEGSPVELAPSELPTKPCRIGLRRSKDRRTLETQECEILCKHRSHC
ncbi:hypothetical protein KC335_g14 [Hortaea werneckii]|nr:hypothetical protein KC335_g14 [Hortaea werneckii]